MEQAAHNQSNVSMCPVRQSGEMCAGLAATHTIRISAEAQLLHLQLQCGQTEDAVTMGYSLLSAYERVHVPGWPVAALLQATLSSACEALGRIAESWSLGHAAVQSLNVTHSGTDLLDQLEDRLSRMRAAACHAFQ